MSRARALLLAALGLALPAALALAVYLSSAGDLGAVPAVVSVPSQQIASPAAATTTTAAPTEPVADDDLPGKCKDPKHRLDPDCDPRARDDDDSSGSGSGSDSGDDDSSGKGSGGDRSDDDD